MASNGVNNSEDTSKDKIEEAKRIAAFKCVDDQVQCGQVIGVGSGTTALYSIKRLSERFHNGSLTNIHCIPTSFDSRQLLIKHQLPVNDLERCPEIDVYIDGADEVDHQLNCIKGGGGCLLEEKIVMSCSKKFFLIADYRKNSYELGQNWKYIPIEVVRNAYFPIQKRIVGVEGGVCKLRTGSGKVGPLVTDNGNFILDWYFNAQAGYYRNNQWSLLDARLRSIPGIIETGLFLGAAEKVYFGMENGTVLECEASKR